MDAAPDAESASQDGPGAATSADDEAGPALSTDAGLAVAPDRVAEHDPEGTETAPPSTTADRRTRRYRADDVSDDDGDLGWGDRPSGSGRGDGWYLSERPPHHG